MSAPRIVLASASPRRSRLLAEAGLEFEVVVADVDEELPFPMLPEVAAETLAERKARAVASRYPDEGRLVVGADTVVAVDDPGSDGPLRLLGKPCDEDEARVMLGLLSGSRHRVVTGVAVVRTPDGACAVGHERTWVVMREISLAEIEAYVESGEWRDKAGGYAIQETADAFVTAPEEGGFDNVVGLPVALTRDLISRL